MTSMESAWTRVLPPLTFSEVTFVEWTIFPTVHDGPESERENKILGLQKEI